MKLNSPLPQPLPKECDKAAKIFKSFVDRGNNGLDGVIPRAVLENAKGFAIFTIFKAGFLFSARAGSGIVIARLDDGSWSAPSAIGTAGVGIGGQAGAEMTDFLVVLNSRSAIRSFMAAGSLTLGGNMSIALGPLGRNGEASGSLNTSGKVAAMYSYSKTRGLFGGVSIEGSVIVERQDANATAYQSDVTAKMLLGGQVEPPPWASTLIKTLEACTGLPGNRKWVQDGAGDGRYIFEGVSSPGTGTESGSSFLRKKHPAKPTFPPASWGAKKDSGSYFSTEYDDLPQTHVRSESPWDNSNGNTPQFGTHFESDVVHDEQQRRHPSLTSSPSPFSQGRGYLQSRVSNPAAHSRSTSTMTTPSPTMHSSTQARRFSYNQPSTNPFSHPANNSDEDINDISNPSAWQHADISHPVIHRKPELQKPLLPHEGVARAIALHNFKAVETGDLSFSKGDVITIIQKSDSTDDWWTGKIGDRQGVFPANYVEVV